MTSAETPARRDPAAHPAATLVLAGGHESRGAGGLRPSIEGGHAFRATGVGRQLADAVTEALALSDLPVCVVPMTLGRDPRLVAEAARTLRWLAGSVPAGRLALTEPFGNTGHLVGWLRAAAGAGRQDTAVLVAAPAAGPFEDAELFRVARLVRQYGTHRWVEVAFEGGDPDLVEGVERCRRLGARRITTIPAAFGAPGPVPGADDGGLLLGTHAIAGVLRARVATALHRLSHGADGIAAGLDAEHGHGYAHSQGSGEARQHGDPHHTRHPHHPHH